MRRVLPILLLLAPWHVASAQEPAFGAAFRDATLRIDFFHTGNATEQIITLDRLVEEGPWAGPTVDLVDPFGNGTFQAVLADPDTGRTLYSKGFDSLFGEYATTSDAREGKRRTFHESALVPFPTKKVRFVLRARDRQTVLHDIFSADIDPASTSIVREAPDSGVQVVVLSETGAHHDRVDLAIVGEGYVAREEAKFRSDLARAAAVLFSHEPFASAKGRFNVYGIFTPSQDSGCDEPSRGVWRRTAVDASFDSFGSERYLLTENNRRLRDVAGAVPYDALLVMVNSPRYGGGGIYNLYCTFTSDNQWFAYLLTHEFGHAFAGLADEYYTSSVAYSDFYPRGVEPTEPNITALLAPEQLKWRALVTPDTPVPTPWEKQGFDEMDLAYQKVREELNDQIAVAMRSGRPAEEVSALKDKAEDLSRQHALEADAYLARSAHVGQVGAFEGAGYASTGMYRPMLDCIMFSKGDKPFCRVCEAAIRRVIDHFAPPTAPPPGR